MDIREISAAASIDGAAPLLQEHWEEIARNKAVMVLKPHVQAYRELERTGSLISLGAFVDDQMVGYAVTVVTRHLHYADLTYAQNDVIFVSRKHRTGRAGLALMRETERIATDRGCKLVMWHAKEDTALAAMLPRMGYAVQDIVFSRELA